MATAVRENDSAEAYAPSTNGNRLPPKAQYVRPKGRPRKDTSGSKAEHRIQVKLTDAGKERLDELVERSGGESAAFVVRDALRIYDILTEEVILNHGQLIIEDPATGERTKLRLW